MLVRLTQKIVRFASLENYFTLIINSEIKKRNAPDVTKLANFLGSTITFIIIDSNLLANYFCNESKLDYHINQGNQMNHSYETHINHLKTQDRDF